MINIHVAGPVVRTLWFMYYMHVHVYISGFVGFSACVLAKIVNANVYIRECVAGTC